MAYIRDGYVVISKSKKKGRRGYGHLGRNKFLVGKNKGITVGVIVIPKKYWNKTVMLKLEVLN